jgi:hypothetical protein
MVWQQAALPFMPDQARELVLYLARSCKNITCGDQSVYTCDNGACTKPVAVDTTKLRRVESAALQLLYSPF